MTRAPFRFKLVSFEIILMDKEPFYLIQGVIPKSGLVLVWGPPKCGKSFIVFDMLMHIARGLAYHGRRTSQGSVVYCAPEGASGFKLRVEAYRQRHGPEADEGWPFYLVPQRLQLAADYMILVNDIKAQLDHKPAAIVVDTVNRSIHGSESDDKIMVPYLSAADALRDTFNCVVILIHHCGHDDSRPRGHSSLTGNVDAQIAVKRDTAQNVVATVEFMKDGPEGASIVNRLEPLEVGRDDDGNPITSCVVEPIEGEAPKPSPSTRPRKLSHAATIAKRALAEAINEADTKAPPSISIPPNAMVATLDQWRTIAFRIGISTSDKSHAQQVAFNRATQMLIADGHVGFSDPYAWLK